MTWDPQQWSQFKTVIAVSGGADSVGMLRVLQQLAKEQNALNQLVVAHVNHAIRADSDQEQLFVQKLASDLNLDFIAHRLGATESESASEESLRNGRYDALLQIAAQTGARYIATAHHRDDQIETLLFRILRGTGLSGLKGIPKFRRLNHSVTLVRPFLDASRIEIEAALESLKQTFCNDSSNSDSEYTRNFLRHEVLPLIESRFGNQTRAAILRLSEQAAEVDEFLRSQSDSLLPAVIEQSPDQIRLECETLTKEPDLLVRHFLVSLWNQQSWPMGQMNANWWNQLARFAGGRSTNTVLNLPGNIRAERNKNQVLLSR